jgi:hypothetical protein
MANVSQIKSKTFAAALADTNSIMLNQSLTGAGNLTLTDGSTGASAHAYRGVDVPGNLGTTITLTSTTAVTNNGINLTIEGLGVDNDIISETLVGPAGSSTVTSTKVFTKVREISQNGTSTDIEAGTTATTTGTGVVFGGRTRVRGMHIVPSGTAGLINFHNTSTTGTKLLEMGVHTDQTPVDPYIPDNGVLFDAGSFIDLGATDLATSISVFYDG